MAERTATRVAFDDVVRLSKERTSDPDADGFDRYVGLDHIDPGDLRIRRWGDVADGTTFTNVFRPGQVLFGKRRAYQRKVAVADFEGVCSGDIYVLESKDRSALLPELLPFICQTDAFFEHAVGTSAGSLSPRTNWSSLAAFEFNLPSITDQHKVLAILAAIERLRLCTSDLEEALTTALMADLTANTNARFTTSKSVEKHVNYVVLGDLIDVHHGYAFSSRQFVQEDTEDPVLLVPANFTLSGRLKFRTTKRFCGEVPERFRLPAGELVVLMTDLTPSARLLGAPGIVPVEPSPLLHNQRIGRVEVLEPALVSKEFVFYCFLGEPLRRQIRAASAGSTVHHTSPSEIRALQIGVPSTEDQAALCTRWSALHDAIEAAGHRAQKVLELRSLACNRLLGGAGS